MTQLLSRCLGQYVFSAGDRAIQDLENGYIAGIGRGVNQKTSVWIIIVSNK